MPRLGEGDIGREVPVARDPRREEAGEGAEKGTPLQVEIRSGCDFRAGLSRRGEGEERARVGEGKTRAVQMERGCGERKAGRQGPRKGGR